MRLRLLASGLVVVATLFATPAATAPADIPILTPDELGCQQAIFNAGTDFVTAVFSARQICYDAVTRGQLPSSVNCRASLDEGTGNAETDQKVATAAANLSTTIQKDCFAVTLENLGFPGACEDPFGPPFDSFDLEECLVDVSNEIIAGLLHIEHPPFPGPVSTNEATCQDTIATRASTMFATELDQRAICERRRFEQAIPDSVNCRLELDRLEPGTGHRITDNGIVEAHNKVLHMIANACERNDLLRLGFPHRCPSAVDSEYTVAEVVECMYVTHHRDLIPLLDTMSPSTRQCGNGTIDLGEECDDGDFTWAPGEICRHNCTVLDRCGDTDDDGRISAPDALFILRASVGIETCALSICDVTGDGRITAADALLALQHAIGLPVELVCPPPLLTCGDGILDEIEACDMAENNGILGRFCSGICSLVPCGDPNHSLTFTVFDALFVLRTAVGLEMCDHAVCDVDNNGFFSTADALRVLRRAVGLDVPLVCPDPPSLTPQAV